MADSTKNAPREFRDAARADGIAWKTTSDVLVPEARLAGPYEDRPGPFEYGLPEAHRWLNLLPDAREVARARFEAAGIRWHGDGNGPNPHTCSSQIQCLNALAPHVDDPDALARLFGSVLPIAEVIEFGASTTSPFDATDHVVFEWLGAHDHLGEWGPSPQRGARATSADAAIRYRTHSGEIEIALIEWKYIESYPHRGRLSGSARYHDGRLRRYLGVLDGPDSPIRADRSFTYEDLFAEPVYQLARTQALAAAMEAAHELGASTVRVVYAAPSANTALLRQSLGTMRFEAHALAFGGSLIHAWRAALRQPDRFVHLDTARWVADDSPASAEFRSRYQHLGTAAPAVPERPSTNAESATTMARMVLERISSDGGVLEQVLALLARDANIDSSLLTEYTARVEEVTELARRLRAEQIAELLYGAEEAPGPSTMNEAKQNDTGLETR